MSQILTTPAAVTARAARPRHYVMCPPTEFDVVYAINPWMDPTVAVDAATAHRQWQHLHDTYLGLGHRVDLLDPVPGLPDMVFAANGAVSVGPRTYGAAFAFPQRQAEAHAHVDFLRGAGREVERPAHVNEGEGDFLVLAELVLAGHGFRTARDAHEEAARVLDRRVVSLELVDPRFYHLDVALGVLDDGGGATPADVAWFPGAFSPSSRRVLRRLFPGSLECSEADALAFGLNLVSDGVNVVLPSEAAGLADAVAQRGYRPAPVGLTEFVKGGGSVKCCTAELHR
ncbi:amidinotransferase [Aeromicrobium flavum]|uniref:Amidinotransferase n=1 Tax=Aeromicrobium flavum TaxID=416568 RepID=A0A512HSC2_9ACTN|nr:dimethylargininase [Aeromicrobium flavum]GEO88347.1 amidinotransferase [Aeromicrobium flavum]